MKKTIAVSFLFTLISMAAFISPVRAQDAMKELEGFTKKFEAAYNKQDVKALKDMYTADASRVATDGTTITGNDNIVAEFSKNFADTKVTIQIKPETATKETDGTVTATGTYHVSGTTNAGEKIERDGKYTNSMTNDKGAWKISKSVLTTP